MEPRSFDALARSLASSKSRRGLLAGIGALVLGARGASATVSPCPPGQTLNTKGDCSCPAGTDACPNGCFNKKKDPTNCGRCGNVCPADTTCVKGECRCPAGGCATTTTTTTAAPTTTTTTTTAPTCTPAGQPCDLQDAGACCSDVCFNGSPTPTCGPVAGECTPDGQPCDLQNAGACCSDVCFNGSPTPVCYGGCIPNGGFCEFDNAGACCTNVCAALDPPNPPVCI